MIRIIVTILVPLLLPTVVYMLWMATFGRTDDRTKGLLWRGPVPPWPWLVIFVLTAAGMVALPVAFDRSARQGTYVPPHVVDGKVVQGEVVPAAPATR